MARAQLGHGVVGDTRQLEADLALGDVLDRRIGQRDHLAIVAEGVHLAEALVEVEQFGHHAQALAEILELRRDLGHLGKETLRIDMGVDVDQRRHENLPWSMILSENRYPLFGIILYESSNGRPT